MSAGRESARTIVITTVLSTVFYSLAIVATVFRLVNRKRRKQFSWDDWWALAAAFFDSVVFICSCIRFRIDRQALKNDPLPMKLQEGVYEATSVAFTCTIWASRISIACSILRVLPSGRTRSFVYFLTWVFFFNIVVMLILKNYVCGRKHVWIDCSLGHAINIFKLCTDIVSNVLLVVIPLFILRHTRLPKAPLYMIRAVFVTTMCMISICTIRVIYVMRNNVPLNGITTNLEAAVTLLVCNLLVLVTFVYRHIRNGRDLDHELSEYLSHARNTPAARGLTIFTSISAQESPGSTRSTTGRGTSVFLELGSSLFGKKGEVIVSSVLTPRTPAPGLPSHPPTIMTVHSCRSVFPYPDQQGGKSKSEDVSHTMEA
ncbi:hypothetical protein E4T56_gene6208, partial [Termitomyces sp. T112]